MRMPSLGAWGVCSGGRVFTGVNALVVLPGCLLVIERKLARWPDPAAKLTAQDALEALLAGFLCWREWQFQLALIGCFHGVVVLLHPRGCGE